MPNIRNASTSNIVFPSCNISEKCVSDKDDAIQCDICQAGIYLKCNKLNHIDYKYLLEGFVFNAVARYFLLDF